MKKYISCISCILLLSLMAACGNGEESSTAQPDSLSTSASRPLTHEEQERMEMEKHAAQQPQENPYKDAKLDVKVLDNVKDKKEPGLTGYGYDIYLFDAVYVHQPHIPAINGNRGFKTAEQAKLAGEFVANKIRNNIMPPSISVQELDSLGVLK